MNMGAQALSRSAAQTGFLILDTIPATLALKACNVVAITGATEWTLEPPRPLDSLIPIRFSASEPAWVLRIAVGTESIPILVRGVVRIEYLRADALVLMPSRSSRGFEDFSDVVLANGRPFALVVNIDALFRVPRKVGN